MHMRKFLVCTTKFHVHLRNCKGGDFFVCSCSFTGSVDVGMSTPASATPALASHDHDNRASLDSLINLTIQLDSLL